MGLQCRRVRRCCWRYLDGTLSTQARAEVERHLVGCVECRAVFAQAAFALESLQKGLPIEPGSLPYLPRHLRRYLPIEEKSLGWRWSVVVPLLVALIGLVGGIGLVRLLPAAHRPLSFSPHSKQNIPNPASLPKASRADGSAPRSLGIPPPLTQGSGGSHSGGLGSLSSPSQGSGATHPHRVGVRSPRKVSTSPNAGRSRRTKAAFHKRVARLRKQIARPSPSHAPVQAPPPEGTIEVYDQSGQLVKRDRVRGNR